MMMLFVSVSLSKFQVAFFDVALLLRSTLLLEADARRRRARRFSSCAQSCPRGPSSERYTTAGRRLHVGGAARGPTRGRRRRAATACPSLLELCSELPARPVFRTLYYRWTSATRRWRRSRADAGPSTARGDGVGVASRALHRAVREARLPNAILPLDVGYTSIADGSEERDVLSGRLLGKQNYSKAYY